MSRPFGSTSDTATTWSRPCLVIIQMGWMLWCFRNGWSPNRLSALTTNPEANASGNRRCAGVGRCLLLSESRSLLTLQHAVHPVPSTGDDTERYSGHDKVHRRQVAGVSGCTDNREWSAASFPRLAFVETTHKIAKAQ